MNSHEKRNPEELLSAIKKEESEHNRGRLKIFFGMCAGVGKTYAMLEEAQDLQRNGINVVVGLVETHGRQDTAHLLDGLKTVQELSVDYKGKKFKELDVDAIIALKPEIVLVDELAHSNIPGLRHQKRWQDVIEILDNGIDVYTTLNVQHVDSLNDIVKEISQVSIHETVPDLVVEKASSIQIVDLTPDKLLQRLQEGKIYLGDQSRIASQNFFQKDRLTALREIVLRYAAEKVDRDFRDSITTSDEAIQWKIREKFLVAVSYGPESQKLIRTTRRLASYIDAPWVAVYVDNGQTLNEEESNQLARNLRLARDLGGEIVTINDPDISSGIQRIARQRAITQIILGRTPKSFLSFFKKRTLSELLSKQYDDFDLHVVRQEKLRAKFHKSIFHFPIKSQVIPYLIVFFYVCLLTSLNWLLLSVIGYKVIGVIFLIGILGLSLFFKKGPVFFASILYAIAWDLFFIPPAGRFVIASTEDTALLILYVLTAVSTGILVDRAREHKELLVKNEDATRFLYSIGQKLVSAESKDDIFNSIKKQLDKEFDGKFEILETQLGNGLDINKNNDLLATESEKLTAIWSFENGKEAGWSTDVLSSSKNLYIPLKWFQDVVGVLTFKPNVYKALSTEKMNFLYNVSNQVANYLVRSISEDKAKKHEQLEQTEKIYKTILDRLSAEFESPLIIASAAIENWKHKIVPIENSKYSLEAEQIEKSFKIFHKILSNISAMAQLSEGIIPLNKSPQSVQELIEECCDNIKKSKNGHEIVINLQKSLPLVPFDFYLMQILLHNLLTNALEYSPSCSRISVDALTSEKYLVLSVSDEGKGIPEDQINFIFEKFYRLSEAGSPGIGLGLSIAKTIAEAHYGYLKAENLPTAGSKFSLFLPLSPE
jgi:two-component system sensor histidine kinase KdpD